MQLLVSLQAKPTRLEIITPHSPCTWTACCCTGIMTTWFGAFRMFAVYLKLPRACPPATLGGIERFWMFPAPCCCPVMGLELRSAAWPAWFAWPPCGTLRTAPPAPAGRYWFPPDAAIFGKPPATTVAPAALPAGVAPEARTCGGKIKMGSVLKFDLRNLDIRGILFYCILKDIVENSPREFLLLLFYGVGNVPRTLFSLICCSNCWKQGKNRPNIHN